MNFGIIGYGNIAKRFFESIQHTSEGKVIAIGSKSLAANQEFQQEYPEIQVYSTYEDLLADPNIDAVYLALPHQWHKEWSIKALQQGIPVLCEKPAVLTTAAMKEIMTVAQENQTLFMEAFKTKFNKGFLQLKKDMEQIGEIKRIEASFCFDVGEDRDTTSYLFQADHGGALNDVGTYSIGFVQALIASAIQNVQAKAVFFNGVDEYFKATLTFENGTMAIVEGAIDREKERIAIIIGEHGKITIPYFYRLEQYTIQLNNQSETTYHFPIKGDDMTLEIEHFMEQIKEKRCESSVHSLEDTYQIIATMEKIRQKM